jgi:hypothetical protein
MPLFDLVIRAADAKAWMSVSPVVISDSTELSLEVRPLALALIAGTIE